MIDMSRVRHLIFDLGDVLIHYRWHEMLQDYGLGPMEADRIGTEMFSDPGHLWHYYDLGASTEETIRAYRGEYPEDGDVIEWFIRHGEYMHVPRPRVWSLVHRLKEEGFGIYLLSNYPMELYRKHTEYADFMQDLDGAVISGELGISKPDLRIYETLCRQYDLRAQECLFFDDRPENVLAAEEYGMQARQVLSHNSLIVDLEDILEGEELADRDLRTKEKKLQ